MSRLNELLERSKNVSITDEDEIEVLKWFHSRPLEIQELCLEFPPENTYSINGIIYYGIGYSESKGDRCAALILSKVNPFENYDLAISKENKIYVCINCVRNELLKTHSDCKHQIEG